MVARSNRKSRFPQRRGWYPLFPNALRVDPSGISAFARSSAGIGTHMSMTLHVQSALDAVRFEVKCAQAFQEATLYV
jgi:hypothetical protein